MSLFSKLAKTGITPEPNRNLKSSDLSIRGTGLEKRELSRSIDGYEKTTEKAFGERGQDLAIAEAERKFHAALDDTIAAMERDARSKNIILDDSQRAAFLGVMKNQVCCLIGPAGSGKTTLEKLIVSQLAQKAGAVVLNGQRENVGSKSPGIAIAAFTGRAAQQSAKAVGKDYDIPIRTMHSLLGYAPVFEEVEAIDEITGQIYMKEVRRFRPTYNETCKLPYNIYIIDEAPMMPVDLFNEFIDAIHPKSRIILVGDINQLPPVMNKSVLGYALQKWPVFELTKIHRQAEGNAIIKNAHNVLNGLPLQKSANVHLLEAPSDCGGSLKFSEYIKKVTVKLRDIGKKHKEDGQIPIFDPHRDAIIVANSKKEIVTSTHALNSFFMSVFNPPDKQSGITINPRIAIHTGVNRVDFAVGDKVMNCQNNNNHNPPITNGMMGIVESIALNGKYDMKRAPEDMDFVEHDESDEGEEDDAPVSSLGDFAIDNIHLEIDNIIAKQQVEKAKKKDEEDISRDQRQASHIMTVKFETGQTIVCSTSGDYNKIEFGYVITCHKSQGGEYPTVIICLHSANGTLLSREWLYTAFTRARENVFVLYNKEGLKRALKNQKVKGATLKEKLMNYVIQAKSDDMDLTQDPWNVDRKKFPILFNPKEV